MGYPKEPPWKKELTNKYCVNVTCSNCLGSYVESFEKGTLTNLKNVICVKCGCKGTLKKDRGY